MKEKKKRKRERDSSSLEEQSRNVKDEEYDDEEERKMERKEKKKKRKERIENEGNVVTTAANFLNHEDEEKDRKNKKKAKKKRKQEEEETGASRKEDKEEHRLPATPSEDASPPTTKKNKKQKREPKSMPSIEEKQPDQDGTALTFPSRNVDGRGRHIPFDYQYILAPMVGASELPFRLLCRKYGAQLCYTPMMSSTLFVRDAHYRQTEFQTTIARYYDRPLVCHFSANDPKDFAQAAVLVQDQCDAIDLNLGCPQRTAYVGHFGSYLLDPVDRSLVLDMVRAASQAVSIPIFCKIRLLDTLDETIALCQQLEQAGAALIAIHARYRASWERTGPGARDGPAMLDQITTIRQQVQIPIITNGNTKTYDDVLHNLELTQADGIMSAEGILDNPALYLPRLGSKEEDGDKLVTVLDSSSVTTTATKSTCSPPTPPKQPSTVLLSDDVAVQKKRKRLSKKLREIERIEQKLQTDGPESIDQDQKGKLASKDVIQKQLTELDQPRNGTNLKDASTSDFVAEKASALNTKKVKLRDLYEMAEDKLLLANEYLSLVRLYPTKIRTVVFHIRRMIKTMLDQYQLLEDLLAATHVDEVQVILSKCHEYRNDPRSFEFDRNKAKRQKEALERRRHEEGKRKAFEARMIRKAKREGKSDGNYYLRVGSQLPTAETIARLKTLTKEQQLWQWKELDHSQHCLAFHLLGGCQRDRACAFLHVEAKNANTFDEGDEVAG